MPDGGLAPQVSQVGSEVAKLAVGAVALWAWRAARTISGLAPRMDSVESALDAMAEFALAAVIDERLAKMNARLDAADEISGEALEALGVELAELKESSRVEVATLTARLAHVEGMIAGRFGDAAAITDRGSQNG